MYPWSMWLEYSCVDPKVAATVDSLMMSTESSSKKSHVLRLLMRLT